MGVLSDADLVGKVFEITIPHGVRPKDAACAWSVRPLR